MKVKKVVNILSNRKTRRAQPKELQKATKDINSLTPMQASVAHKVAMEKADIIVDRYIQNFETLFDRNMSAALVDYGIEYEDIEGIQKNMSKMLIEDSRKSKKLEEGHFNMAVIEQKVLDEVKQLLVTQISKKESIERLIFKFPKLSKSMLLNAYVKVRKEMGLTENRISKEIVYAEFDKNVAKLSGADAIANAMKKFNFTESTAKTYYSKWKNQYMAGKIVTDPVAPTDEPIVKEVPAIEQVEEKEEIEMDIDTVKPNGLKVIESTVVVRKTIKVEGAGGTYVADTENGVTLSKVGMDIYFNTIEELDEWVAEYKAVFALVM